MLFSSIPFLYYFLPGVILVYFAVPKQLKNVVLLLSSLLFYAWSEQMLVVLFMATILVGYVLGLLIEKYRDRKLGKAFMVLSVVLNLFLLCYFKYMDFFIVTINSIFSTSIPVLKIALPIGISFYIFQILSYTIDVYRGMEAQKNIIHFGTYVALFPQLIAGPIVRYADIKEQLSDREHSLEKCAEGVRRFLYGLSKKVLLANVLGEICIHFRQTTDVSVLYYWMYAIAFMLQIYYDFSGYSDMAIGLAKIFGFELVENFDYPYVSKSITEFWRRWHMSLGSWFRDYVYIPLGGNRKGIKRQLINIGIVWMLTGLWHGAAINFVLWGLFYALLLTMEKVFLGKWLKSHPVMGHIYVVLTVMLGFVLFNAESLIQVGQDLSGMFFASGIPLISKEAVYYMKSYLVVFILGIVGATPLYKKVQDKILDKCSICAIIEPIFLTVLLLIVTAYLVDGSFNPFLYFRF